MALIDTLTAAGVEPITGPIRADCTLFQASVGPLRVRRPLAGPAGPLVSCLMVTSGERSSIRLALECYRRQLYGRREMVIVTYLDRLEAVRAVLEALGVADASLHGVGRGLSLGEMRNVAVARAGGDILVQWDDDDLCDPARITTAAAILTQSPAAAAMLWRVLIWWPQLETAAVSESRLWENSIAVWRENAPVYPALNRLEDTHAVEYLAATQSVAAVEMPLLYVYVAHGANTCEDEHFLGHMQRAACVLRGADYAELIGLLANRMPILDYRVGVGL